MLALKTILHPTDFSETSAHALRMAYQVAQDYGARLILLHAVEPPVYYGEFGATFTAADEYAESARERLLALVEPEAGVDVETLMVEGIASPEILRLAEERSCDLIVIGSHGRTGLGRVLMGSVAEEVARKSPCPVLIVRLPHETPHDAPVAAHAAAH
jgi:nucleotide-binding universal stress UspA family protein